MKVIYKANVRSQSDPSVKYLVRELENGRWLCSCPDSVMRSRECKHIKRAQEYRAEKENNANQQSKVRSRTQAEQQGRVRSNHQEGLRDNLPTQKPSRGSEHGGISQGSDRPTGNRGSNPATGVGSPNSEPVRVRPAEKHHETVSSGSHGTATQTQGRSIEEIQRRLAEMAKVAAYKKQKRNGGVPVKDKFVEEVEKNLF